MSLSYFTFVRNYSFTSLLSGDNFCHFSTFRFCFLSPYFPTLVENNIAIKISKLEDFYFFFLRTSSPQVLHFSQGTSFPANNRNSPFFSSGIFLIVFFFHDKLPFKTNFSTGFENFLLLFYAHLFTACCRAQLTGGRIFFPQLSVCQKTLYNGLSFFKQSNPREHM